MSQFGGTERRAAAAVRYRSQGKGRNKYVDMIRQGPGNDGRIRPGSGLCGLASAVVEWWSGSSGGGQTWVKW